MAKIASTSNDDIAQARHFGIWRQKISLTGFGAITTEGLVRDINISFSRRGNAWPDNGSVPILNQSLLTSKNKCWYGASVERKQWGYLC